MAADLYIHVLTKEFTEEHYKAFQSHTLGSKYFSPGYERIFEQKHNCKLYELCAETPRIWVGEVSWLKAALFDDSENFVPNPVQKVNELIGENFPVIGNDLITQIEKAMNLENATMYSLAEPKSILEFLNTHKGEKAFTISW